MYSYVPLDGAPISSSNGTSTVSVIPLAASSEKSIDILHILTPRAGFFLHRICLHCLQLHHARQLHRRLRLSLDRLKLHLFSRRKGQRQQQRQLHLTRGIYLGRLQQSHCLCSGCCFRFRRQLRICIRPVNVNAPIEFYFVFLRDSSSKFLADWCGQAYVQGECK